MEVCGFMRTAFLVVCMDCWVQFMVNIEHNLIDDLWNKSVPC